MSMANLTKVEAARHLGCSRTFVYTMIAEGILQVLPDGKISAEECARVQVYVDIHAKGASARERPRTDLRPQADAEPFPSAMSADMFANRLMRIEDQLALLTK